MFYYLEIELDRSSGSIAWSATSGMADINDELSNIIEQFSISTLTK